MTGAVLTGVSSSFAALRGCTAAVVEATGQLQEQPRGDGAVLTGVCPVCYLAGLRCHCRWLKLRGQLK